MTDIEAEADICGQVHTWTVTGEEFHSTYKCSVTCFFLPGKLSILVLSLISSFPCSYSAYDWLASSSALESTAPSGRVATLSLKSFSACCQTRTFFQSLRPSRLGSRAALKASDASRGSKLGRWSMLMTLRGRPLLPSGKGTGTVGLVKVVLMS